MTIADPGSTLTPAADGRGSVRVLVVDDEPAVRRFAVRALAEEGFAVREAADGAEALALVRNGPEPIDVIVSDVIMPRLNGADLYLAVSSSHPQIAFILMSGYATGELQNMGIDAPCGILSKPFTVTRLVEEVRRCLSGSSV